MKKTLVAKDFKASAPTWLDLWIAWFRRWKYGYENGHWCLKRKVVGELFPDGMFRPWPGQSVNYIIYYTNGAPFPPHYYSGFEPTCQVTSSVSEFKAKDDIMPGIDSSNV